MYSSHVLDHFSLERVQGLLGEIHQVLCPGGVLHVSVPDLARNAEKYLRSLRENRDNPLKHQWHTIKLLDQMTRTEFGDEKAKFLRFARSRPDVQAWLRPVLGSEMLQHLDRVEKPPTFKLRLKEFVKQLLYRRRFEDSGERHYWTFDEISLGQMLREAAFARVERTTWHRSLVPEFLLGNLDAQDAVEYKPGSLYMEAVK